MKRKDILFIIMTILLVMLTLFCTTETVMSQSSGGRLKEYYAGMEKQYLSDIKEALCEKGYADSGVTIRWVSDGEGLRNYTVMIHHRKLNALDNNKKEELINELSAAEFSDERCSFNYEFITT